MASWRGRVRKHLFELRERGCKAFFALIDPEKPPVLQRVKSVLTRSTAILIGGSLGVTPYDVDRLVIELREGGVDKPVIIFPGGLNNIGKEADAILYMSLLNSLDPYWISGAQVAAAPIVYRLGLEALPTAYIIVGYGGAAGHVGRAQVLPLEKPELIATYVLAAKYMGMQFVYIEAGSGAPSSVPPEAVRMAREVAPDVYLIVGGGIRDAATAKKLVEAGADAIVLGTLIERNPEKAAEIAAVITRCT